MDKLVEFLELNNNIAIEIRSHTDSRGNEDYNLKLSDKRAASVVKYLVAHGINSVRLESRGMGETDPLEDCSQNPDCGTEEVRNECDCHQKNRRTAFKTTSEDFKDVFKGIHGRIFLEGTNLCDKNNVVLALNENPFYFFISCPKYLSFKVTKFSCKFYWRNRF